MLMACLMEQCMQDVATAQAWGWGSVAIMHGPAAPKCMELGKPCMGLVQASRARASPAAGACSTRAWQLVKARQIGRGPHLQVMDKRWDNNVLAPIAIQIRYERGCIHARCDLRHPFQL